MVSISYTEHFSVFELIILVVQLPAEPSGLTLLVFIFDRTSRGHLLDLAPGLLGGLERPELVLLLADPGGAEASVVLRQTGGSRGRRGCRRAKTVRLNNKRTDRSATLTHGHVAHLLGPLDEATPRLRSSSFLACRCRPC